MQGGRLSFRLLVALLLGMLPPILVYHLVVALAPSTFIGVGRGTTLAIAVALVGLWAIIVTVLTGPIIGQEARSMAEIAERGSVTAGDAEGDEAQTSAQRRLAVALDERNRQIAELAAWSGNVRVSDPAGRVASLGVAAAREITQDPTWLLAVTQSSSVALLPPGGYGPEGDSPAGPVTELHQWAMTVGLSDDAAGLLAHHEVGPWGAFVLFRVPTGGQYSAVLMAPWEGRKPPSQSELELLRLVGQHVSAAIGHSLLYAQLRAQADELNRMHAVQRDFLRSVSHDLQTPLTSISALAAEVRADPLIAEQSAVDLEAIRTQADRLRRMVGQLLVVSRLEAGAITARQEIVRPVDLVRLVWKALRAPEERLEIDVRTKALAIADPDRVEQVLWALLDNALKYGASGGSVHVMYGSRARATNEAELREDAPASELVAMLTISDEGIGMDAATQARAFEQFYRADSARRLVPDGSGVGLYAARGLVELMGGRLKIQSRLGAGTSVVITLPAEQTESGTGDEPVPDSGRE